MGSKKLQKKNKNKKKTNKQTNNNNNKIFNICIALIQNRRSVMISSFVDNVMNNIVVVL